LPPIWGTVFNEELLCQLSLARGANPAAGARVSIENTVLFPYGNSPLQMELTDIGAAYFEFCQELLGGIAERERSIVRPQSQLQGSLKISASKGFGSLCIADAVVQFSLEHEEIVVTLPGRRIFSPGL
jgi:DNA-binding transcriptional LysR family regulator